jgi:SET and MYND domain-containing protein 4
MQMLALRLLIKTGWQHLHKNKLTFERILQQTDERPSLPNKDRTYQWNNYENILELQTNAHRRSVDDRFQRSIQACIIGISLINNTSFCQDAYDNVNYQIYICSLILSHLQSLPCNAHEISEFVYHRLQPLSSSCIEIGAGIYATLSFFNHSCHPNVIRNFIGETVVVRLLSSISSDGIELSDNYGCLSATMPKDERQKKLAAQYHFDCQCQPCVEQWPTYDHLPDRTGQRKICSNLFDEAFQRLIKGDKPKKDDLTVFEEFLARFDDENMSEKKCLHGKVYNNALSFNICRRLIRLLSFIIEVLFIITCSLFDKIFSSSATFH